MRRKRLCPTCGKTEVAMTVERCKACRTTLRGLRLACLHCGEQVDVAGAYCCTACKTTRPPKYDRRGEISGFSVPIDSDEVAA